MNRRSFISGIIAACAAPMILPSALMYSRRWIVQRGVVQPEPLDLYAMLELSYAIKRARMAKGHHTDFWIVGDRKQAEEFRKKMIQLHTECYQIHHAKVVV